MSKHSTHGTLPPIAPPPDTSGSALAPPPNAGGEATPSQQKRHRSRFRRSRKVLIVKVTLPLAAISLIAVILAWPYLRPGDDEFILDTKLPVETRSANPQVLNPRLSGFDENGQPFEITADIGTATVGEDGDEIYYLTKPKADIALNGGAWIALTASDGIYEPRSEVLTLREGVSLFHDSGVEFTTETARIMMGERAAEGNMPVFGIGDFGEIEAEGFRIVDQGDRVIFTGKTRLLLINNGTLLFAGTSDRSRKNPPDRKTR